MVLALLLLGCGRDDPPDPPGDPVWVMAGGSNCFLTMSRANERITLFGSCEDHVIGTLTPAGLSAWDDAVASVDPAAVPGLPRCAPTDGIDICFDLEGDGDLFAMCYCADDPPPPEVAELHAYFEALVTALHDCESSDHIVIDLCE